MSTTGLTLSPGLLGPFAAGAMWLRRRPGWLVGVALVWITLLTSLYALFAGFLGQHLHVTSFGVVMHSDDLDGRVFLLVLLGFNVVLHRLLTRPEVRAVFRPSAARAWGPWTTMTVAGLIALTSQVAGGIAAAWLLDLPNAELMDTPSLLRNGSFVALTACIGGLVTIALLAACIRLRGEGDPRPALALRPVGGRTVVLALVAMTLLTFLEAGVSAWFERPLPEFMRSLYRSTESPTLLWLAIVVMAPVSEELLFRGFLFGGLTTAGFATATTVLLTTATFASMHVGQYDAWAVAYVALLGVAVGLARARTGSVYPAIAMHAWANACALVATSFMV